LHLSHANPPTQWHAERRDGAYYARRAGGWVGMIITEATLESDELGCVAYLNPPGIANAKHVAGCAR
jgi:2,4-dienoyl-CoA reductase-like NADH-dependent reductase (Old Yellow Enzyme family)